MLVPIKKKYFSECWNPGHLWETLQCGKISMNPGLSRAIQDVWPLYSKWVVRRRSQSICWELKKKHFTRIFQFALVFSHKAFQNDCNSLLTLNIRKCVYYSLRISKSDFWKDFPKLNSAKELYLNMDEFPVIFNELYLLIYMWLKNQLWVQIYVNHHQLVVKPSAKHSRKLSRSCCPKCLRVNLSWEEKNSEIHPHS